MKSIVCTEPGTLELICSKKPEPRAGQVRIAIRAIGICGTDIHAYNGSQPFFEYPRILGHELSGVIDAVGEGVNLPIGQSAYIIPYVSCDQCVACRNGKTNCCREMQVLGVHQDGGMSEFICVPASAVVIAEGLKFDELALIECLAIGAHAIRRANVTANDTVLVMGAGPIGIGVVQFAQETGANVLVSDLSNEKLNFCRKHFGLLTTINAKDDVKLILDNLTQGDFPSIVIDCTGSAHAMESAFNYVGHGGSIVFVSIVKANITFSDPEFHKRETTLLSSRNATRQDFEHVVRSMRLGTLNGLAMVTHRVKFSRLIEQFPAWTNPEFDVIKAIVQMD